MPRKTASVPETDGAMPISVLAEKLDISPRTIRYYEEIGLLDTVRRTSGGKRIYTNDDFRRLRFIKKLKLLGLTLADMQELEDIYKIHRKNSKVFPRLIEQLDTHKKEVDRRIQELTALRKEIDEFKERMREKVREDT